MIRSYAIRIVEKAYLLVEQLLGPNLVLEQVLIPTGAQRLSNSILYDRGPGRMPHSPTALKTGLPAAEVVETSSCKCVVAETTPDDDLHGHSYAQLSEKAHPGASTHAWVRQTH